MPPKMFLIVFRCAVDSVNTEMQMQRKRMGCGSAQRDESMRFASFPCLCFTQNCFKLMF